MFMAMMKPIQNAVRASRVAQAEERCRAQPCPRRLAELQEHERRAMENLILAQIWWGPYWSFAELCWGGLGEREIDEERRLVSPDVKASSTPLPVAAE